MADSHYVIKVLRLTTAILAFAVGFQSLAQTLDQETDRLTLVTEKASVAGNMQLVQANTKQTGLRRADGSDVPYDQYIRELYGIDDTAKALTVHINNLLQFYAYGDDRVVANTRFRRYSRHKVKHSNQGEIISFNKLGRESSNPFVEDRFSVFGLSPHITYRCSAATANCWLHHPVTAQRWLQIRRDEKAALEIAKAISQLIRTLQKSGTS